ncbi:chemosensory receptor A [Elysia marginata]|uniref:Chemosensory receptor A n=1 Tax=Elysia marginata TaxID=1093978 RepID=A0AAV4JUB7_9GAST|nr:chemosensory receptor A [Elysia marginata]
MIVYETVFVVLMLTIVRPPFNKPNPTRVVLLLYSYSIPAFTCFGLVLISTAFIIIRLRKTLEWRTSTSTHSAQTSGVKERKAVLSVLWICIMFIVCFTPFVVMFVTTIINPNLTLWDPYYGWLVHTIYTYNFLFQSISSAFNFVVYYNVSTRFREVLKGLFVSE